MPEPTAPKINLNGSAGTDLIKGYSDAHRALDAALDALARITPHGRDYQTSPEGDYEKARAEHIARCTAVRAVRDEMMDLALSVRDQLDARHR